MIIWDSGIYEPLTPMDEGLGRGHLSFVLSGRRLQGEFALVRLRRGATGREWLLMKKAVS